VVGPPRSREEPVSSDQWARDTSSATSPGSSSGNETCAPGWRRQDRHEVRHDRERGRTSVVESIRMARASLGGVERAFHSPGDAACGTAEHFWVTPDVYLGPTSIEIQAHSHMHKINALSILIHADADADVSYRLSAARSARTPPSIRPVWYPLPCDIRTPEGTRCLCRSLSHFPLVVAHLDRLGVCSFADIGGA